MKSNTVVEILAIVMVLIIGFMFVGLSTDIAPEILPDGADIPAVTYLECFEDPDVNETNPDGKDVGGTTIYTYAETDWTLANVTDLYGAPVSDQSYWVNDSDGDGCYSTFTFASKSYTSASFYFMMNDAYHKQTIVRLEAADGSDLMFINITDTECQCYEGDGTLLWDEDINSGTWYKLSVALNWEGTFTASLYSVNIAGLLSAVGDGGTGDMSAGAVAYGSCAIVNVSGVAGEDAVIYLDNLQLYKAQVDGVEADISEVSDLYAGLVAVVIFAIVLTLLFVALFAIRKKK